MQGPVHDDRSQTDAEPTARRPMNQGRAMGLAGRKLVLERYSMPVATAGLKAALAAVCGRDLR